MAHLSERHEIAKRRRDELLRDRSLSLAMRTGYPEIFHDTPPTKLTTANGKQVDSPSPAATLPMEEFDKKKYTSEALAAAQLRCQDRVRTAHLKEMQARRRQRDLDDEQHARDHHSSSDAAAMAAQRLRDRKEKDRRLEEQEVDLLISQQTSSIKAMNIARMLSPRFEERVAFTPSIAKHSVEDGRVLQLLTNPRVGTFYQ